MKSTPLFVIDKRDLEADAVSVRLHGKGILVAISRNEATVDLLAEIKKRRA